VRTKDGCRGAALESVQVRGTRCTSREALTRFFRHLSAGHDDDRLSVRTAAQSERAAARAIRELEKAGA